MANKLIKRFIIFLAIIITINFIPVPQVESAESKYNGVKTIKLDKASVKLFLGDKAVISYQYTYSSKYKNKFEFTWSSSNKKVATVKDGIITAIGVGKADITLKSGTATAKCKVTVTMSENQKKVEKVINSVIQTKIEDDMKNVDKVKVIHDYLIENTKYDIDNYNKGTIPDISYTAAGALLKKKAVCQGYAEAFQLFMDKLNIPCKTVTGLANGDSHAWNMVKLGGGWYWVDVTWDDKVPDQGRISYEYFLISDEELKVSHSWNSNKYSANGSKYKYYGYVECTINSIDEISDIVEAQQLNSYLTIVCPEEIKEETLRIAAKAFYEIKGLEYNGTLYSNFQVGDKTGYQIIIDEDAIMSFSIINGR